MKLFLFIAAAFILCSGSTVSSSNEERCFYFCISRPLKADTALVLLYTEVKDTICTILQSRAIASKWGELAENRCQSTSGCTSDVNIYKAKEDAQKNLDNVINRYHTYYKLEKVKL